LPALTRDGDVYVLDLGASENRFNEDSLGEIEACLAEVAGAGPCALVTTAQGKIWSNGLDLEWLSANGEQAGPFFERLHELFAKVLEIGVYTVAALQGHAFGAGAMLALAHDERYMRADRGYFCLPEVDLGMPFSIGMNALVTARLPVRAAHEAMTTGRRFGGQDAAEVGIVDRAVSETEVMPAAVARAAELANKNPAALGAIKQRLHHDTLAALRGPQGF
jgi:Delta3-Delta2-enoyl-CoA isomerase